MIHTKSALLSSSSDLCSNVPLSEGSPHATCAVALTSLFFNLYSLAQLCFPQYHQTCLFECLPLECKLHESRDFVLFITMDTTPLKG